MGLPMFREPKPEETTTTKPNFDSTARSRSTIRRSRTVRHGSRVAAASRDENRRINTRHMEDLIAHRAERERSGAESETREHERAERARLMETYGQYQRYRREAMNRNSNDSSSHRHNRAESDRQFLNRLLYDDRFYGLRDGSAEIEIEAVAPQVTLHHTDGLGDRRRSFSPEESPWEILPATIPMDERLPSASSSFTSTAASTASLAQSRSTTFSNLTTAPSTDSSDSSMPAIERSSALVSDIHRAGPTRFEITNAQDAESSLFVCESEPSEPSDSEDTIAYMDSEHRPLRIGTITNVGEPMLPRGYRNDLFRMGHFSPAHLPPQMRRQIEAIENAEISRRAALATSSREATVPPHVTTLRAEAQEDHLKELIDRLCHGFPVPDHLWGLAGLQRQDVYRRAVSPRM